MKSSRVGRKPYRLSPAWEAVASLFAMAAFVILFVALMCLLGWK